MDTIDSSTEYAIRTTEISGTKCIIYIERIYADSDEVRYKVSWMRNINGVNESSTVSDFTGDFPELDEVNAFLSNIDYMPNICQGTELGSEGTGLKTHNTDRAQKKQTSPQDKSAPQKENRQEKPKEEQQVQQKVSPQQSESGDGQAKRAEQVKTKVDSDPKIITGTRDNLSLIKTEPKTKSPQEEQKKQDLRAKEKSKEQREPNLPAVDKSLYFSEGPLATQHQRAFAASMDRNNPWWWREIFGLLAQATAPVTLVEETGRSLLNVPYNASSGGQYLARGWEEENGWASAIDYAMAISNFSQAFVTLGTLISPLALENRTISGTETVTRELTVKELGGTGQLHALAAKMTVSNGRATVWIDWIAKIEGQYLNKEQILNNLMKIARAEGATTLRIEGMVANEEFAINLVNKYGFIQDGMVVYKDIPIPPK